MCTTGHSQHLPEVIRSEIWHISLQLTAYCYIRVNFRPLLSWAGSLDFHYFWTVFDCCEVLDEENCANLVSISLLGYVDYHNRMRQAAHVHHRTLSTLASGHQKSNLQYWPETECLGLH